MARFHTAVELDSTTVIISNGNSNQTYKKVDLRVSKTHFSVYLLNKNLSTDAIVASWNAEQAFDYGYISLTALEDYLLNLIYGTAIPAHIQSYTAGRSTIDFNNLGGDNWSVGFKIAVNDLSNGWVVNDYDYNVNFAQGGVITLVESGTKTSDYTVTSNLTGNGAGVYGFAAEYHMTNGSDSGFIAITGLVKVDASGNILGSIFNDGMKVNSVNGLQVNYTAYVTQVGVSELINVGAIDANTFALTQLSNSLNGTITLPLGSGGIAVYTDLDPIFWSDLGGLLSNPFALGNFYTLTIL